MIRPVKLTTNQIREWDWEQVTAICLFPITISCTSVVYNDDHFKHLYDEARIKCDDLDLEEPKLPRQRRVPKRLHDYDGRADSSTDHVWESPEQLHRAQYFEVIDLMVQGLERRFNQDTLNYLISIEELIVNAANGEDFVINKLTESIKVMLT